MFLCKLLNNNLNGWLTYFTTWISWMTRWRNIFTCSTLPKIITIDNFVKEKYSTNHYYKRVLDSSLNHNLMTSVVTLALGSRPRQGVARLWAKRKTRESHRLFPWVQRVWGNEPSHSQVNSHGGNWSPKWTPKFSACNFRGQNPSA
jgi:hypothetical protein